MYSTRSNLILGFHGCEKSEQKKLINDPSYIKASNESFDWLGHGMYFWENNPSRGLLWAEQKKMAGRLKEPSVIGAVIDLGRCLDLLDSSKIELLKQCYNLFKTDSEKLDKLIPTNVNHPKSGSHDKDLRYLDCAVIEYTHSFLKRNNEEPFDSVRAAFIEGDPIYPGAGFNEKTHIQICIINPNCIIRILPTPFKTQNVTNALLCKGTGAQGHRGSEGKVVTGNRRPITGKEWKKI